MVTAVSRKQRLRTLENEIRKASEQMRKNHVEIGLKLIEIRDDELWRDEGYDCWIDYFKERSEQLVGESHDWARKLISVAEISKRLPTDSNPCLSASATLELGRLAPRDPHPLNPAGRHDFSRLRQPDLKRVLKSASQIAGTDDSGNPKPLSVAVVRKAVDKDLGIDRAAKAKETKRKQEDDLPELHRYLFAEAGTIDGIRERLETVSEEVWTLLREKRPKSIDRMIAACDSLAEFLRKAGT